MTSEANSQEKRPPKRPRTSQTCPTPSSGPTKSASCHGHKTLKRHAEFWFDDGSIILVARNTGFRVYRALLAAQSPVFANMFSSSSPDAAEMMEGCPVVHLSDDPLDVAHFLGVLLQKSQPTLFTTDCSFSFHQISAIIRLAHKYDIQTVLEQAVSALAISFPSTFAAWERQSKPVVKLEPEHAIGVVGLAWLVERYSLLPLAFYQCAQLGGRIMDGYARENKTIERLDREDTKRCIDGRNELAEREVGIVWTVFDTKPCQDCETPDICRPLLQSIFRNAVYDDKSTDVDVLQSWKEIIEIWVPQQYPICDHCKKALLDRDVAARKDLWNTLSDTFDLFGYVTGWGNFPGVTGGIGSGSGDGES